MSVHAQHVTVRYRDTLALDDVTVEVGAGKVCGLLGVNGSGKSTLFKSLMGLVRPDRGEIGLLGMEPRRARARSLVAYVPQSEAVDWTFPVTVADVVMMGRYGRLGPMRRPKSADRTAVAAALARVGLTELARNPIGALSGGQRKRAFVARGIAQEAQLLLLDEPFAGVDKGSEAVLSELLRGLRDDGRTIMISTHDLAAAPALCDEAVLLHQRVLAHGPVAEVLAPETLARTFGVPEGTR
ncbi:MAG: metal ABC transporter ATP-binding protein [Saccharopolyspora sp.]|uniref:metal ABC transporter ATP-binding protein n=1 Tax=Saccharopolyspora TaxID=1835 RepID=UPI00190A0B10|nr:MULTISPECIES: metal ABC transporter ATP-binding protein [unclassified Saccharopolyspora]MBK0867460.1 metal ABC transporter ATP-binding protein [Saccharopolyspora sp. HNM0986]MBQ6644824.1 metal ABC transporter ATP-binding protein [Saccharopolyspora sp.]